MRSYLCNPGTVGKGRSALFPEAALLYVAPPEEQFAHREPFFARYLQFSEGDPSVGARHADKGSSVALERAARLAVDRGLERRRENLGARRFAVALAVRSGSPP